VAIDRAATLKTAEKLLRQGKVEPAIAEYVRLTEEAPRDWNLANTLGDLYVRAGQVDKAVEQFTRIADSLNEDGFLPRASAIYKKVLKLKPDHEHALLQAGEIAASLGLLADARLYLTQIVERRQARGDRRGASQARIRLGTLDPADFNARMQAAEARVEIGDSAGAARDLKEIAAELLEKDRPVDAIEPLRRAAEIAPDDDEIRTRLLHVYVSTGDFERARACASTSEQLKSLAAVLESAGREDAALEALSEAARLEPDNGELRARLARAFVARGDLSAAAEYLTLETAGNDPQLLFTVAEMRLRGDNAEAGLDVVRRLLEQFPERRDEIASLGWSLAEQRPEPGFHVVELAAEAAVRGQDWAAAAAGLQEFVTRVPHHLPALMRLVEICVDGGLEATMYSAQAQLADAYIAQGQAAEARFIAEDLVAREPWDRANLERFRKALELLGEPDPEALIAERLSGQSPFMTTDLFLQAQELEGIDGTAQVSGAETGRTPANSSEPARSSNAGGTAGQPPDAQAEAIPASIGAVRIDGGSVGEGDRSHFELSANAIDLNSILGELETPPAVAHASTQSVEVDLSVDLDQVFSGLRDEATRRSAADEADGHYRQGLALREAGDIEGCVAALQLASRAPRLRFAAASTLGRLLRERGMGPQSVEWFERAAQAPAPSPEAGHELLYELADVLEKQGEFARALAVSLELQADAGAYRDINARVDRLTKVQARG
jgi:tetratricopeptide (TPR) repeat protein